jgi:protein-tyrosine-phosphatase
MLVGDLLSATGGALHPGLRLTPPKHLDLFADRRFDWVISLCDRVREVCPEFPDQPNTVHWSIADPGAGHVDDETSYPIFQRTAAELDTRIGFLLAELTHRTPSQ